jgi:starch synthase
VPFAKTGGLADVAGALPVELARLGHQATVFLPAYRQVWQAGPPITPTEITFDIPIGSKIVKGRLLKSSLPDGNMPVYLVQQDDYFNRPELYRERGEDYKDNCERFVFFCRAVMESIRQLGAKVDVLHCNDWQTGLIPAYLKIEYRHAAGYEHIVSLITIHNLAYQGNFWHWDMLLTGLDWKYFNYHQMEFYGGLNLLKTGIVFADAVNTVSPRYAQEIQTQDLGNGLEEALKQRRSVLSGIINGVSYDVWNPATDKHLPANYDADSFPLGKAACKAALQQELGLPPAPKTPLIGLVGRLAEQKGWALLMSVMRDWVRSVDAQWAILGTGEPEYHDALAKLAAEYPARIAARLNFSDALAHRIEAGADLFAMASRYEPCGLNQLYSLKYGAVPVVRATGGLADTITDATPENLAAGTATGFLFENFDADSLAAALWRACEIYRQQPEVWSQLIRAGMKEDWSWTASARQYLDLYQGMIERKRQEG